MERGLFFFSLAARPGAPLGAPPPAFFCTTSKNETTEIFSVFRVDIYIYNTAEPPGEKTFFQRERERQRRRERERGGGRAREAGAGPAGGSGAARSRDKTDRGRCRPTSQHTVHPPSQPHTTTPAILATMPAIRMTKAPVAAKPVAKVQVRVDFLPCGCGLRGAEGARVPSLSPLCLPQPRSRYGSARAAPIPRSTVRGCGRQARMGESRGGRERREDVSLSPLSPLLRPAPPTPPNAAPRAEIAGRDRHTSARATPWDRVRPSDPPGSRRRQGAPSVFPPPFS